MEAATVAQTPKAPTPPADEQSAPAAPQEKKQIPVLMPERIGLAENKRRVWAVDLPMTVTLEQALEPSYWAHAAAEMVPMDQIELRAEDGSWIAFLIVAYCERNYAIVRLDRCVRLDADQSAPLSTIKHKVEWKGPFHKYCVIRASDSQVLQSGMRTKEQAVQWMTEHERTLSR